MGIQVGDNFDHKSKKPLDARTSYTTLALMKAVTDANIPEGCLAYCAETDKYYKFLSTNTVDASTGKWREFSSGGGGGGSEYIVELTSLPTPDASLYALYPFGETTAKMARLVNMQSGYQVGCYYQVRRTGSEGSYEYHWIAVDCVTGEITFNSTDFVVSHPSDSSSTHKHTKVKLSGAYYRSDSSSYPDNTDLANDDKFPMYDASVTEDKRRNITWQNLKARLKAYFDTIYNALATDISSPTNGQVLTYNGTSQKWENQTVGIPVVGDIDRSSLYDTTEKVVGKWIDGRPLYQVTITGTLEAMTSTQESNKEYVRTIVDLPMTINKTNIVDFKGVIIMTQNALAPISGGFGFADIGTDVYRGAYGATVFISTDANITKMQAFIDITKWSYGGKTFYITFRYTKTTDSANSFNYADENDYSTTEHIIGTWIDGKKLYQKTINFGALPTGPSGTSSTNSKTVDTGVSNIDRVISLSGYARRGTDGVVLPVPRVSVAPTVVSGTTRTTSDGVNVIYVASTNKVRIDVSADQSAYTECYITIKYTKTT